MRPYLLKGHERPLTQVKYNREGDLLVSCAKVSGGGGPHKSLRSSGAGPALRTHGKQRWRALACLDAEPPTMPVVVRGRPPDRHL